MTNNSRAKELLDKVYDHLASVDFSKWSMRDLQEYVEVLQKAHFLETTGQYTYPAFNGFGGCAGTTFCDSTSDKIESAEAGGSTEH